MFRSDSVEFVSSAGNRSAENQCLDRQERCEYAPILTHHRLLMIRMRENFRNQDQAAWNAVAGHLVNLSQTVRLRVSVACPSSPICTRSAAQVCSRRFSKSRDSELSHEVHTDLMMEWHVARTEISSEVPFARLFRPIL